MLSQEIKTINGIIKVIYQAIRKDLDNYDFTRDAEITSIEFQPATKHVIIYLNKDDNSILWSYDYETFANILL